MDLVDFACWPRYGSKFLSILKVVILSVFHGLNFCFMVPHSQLVCNFLNFIFSLSGWLQSFFAENLRMRNLTYTVLELSCGNL